MTPEPDEDTITTELEQDTVLPTVEPVETNSNDEPAADANGDSDDEHPDEDQAVPDSA